MPFDDSDTQTRRTTLNHNPELIPFGFRIGDNLKAEVVEKQALAEIAVEDHAAAVAAAKTRILSRRAAARWWHKFVPFTVKITRRAA